MSMFTAGSAPGRLSCTPAIISPRTGICGWWPGCSLKRLVDYAEQKNALILLENLNKEPADAEVHYLAHTIEEWQWPGLSMRSIRAGDKSRVEEVRLADCFRNGQEIHLKPDAGDLDFADMFRRIEGKGFTGHYMNAFGSLDDMLAARDDLARHAEAAG
jgi:hypothetical protein